MERITVPRLDHDASSIVPNHGLLMPFDEMLQAVETRANEGPELFDRRRSWPIDSTKDGERSFRLGNVDRQGRHRSFLASWKHNAVRHDREGVGRLQIIDGACERAAGIADSGWRHPGIVEEIVCQSDKIFMSSRAGGVMAITELDGVPVGDWKVGPITHQIWQACWDLHYDDRLSFVIDYTAA